MSGKLLQQARKDALKFVTKGGFEEEITLKTKDGLTELVVKGLTSGHTERFDNEGNTVNSNSVHIGLAEQNLIDGNYPYKSEKSGFISLIGHQIKFQNNTGADVSYVVVEQAPNATTGIITCILGLK